MNPAKNKSDNAYMMFIPTSVDFRKVDKKEFLSGLYNAFKPSNIINWVLHLRRHNVAFLTIIYSIDIFYGQLPLLKSILAVSMAIYILLKVSN